MPYAIRRKGSKYQVVNTENGRVHSTTTKTKADKQLRLLKGIERDWTPTADGAYTRKVNGRSVKLRVK